MQTELFSEFNVGLDHLAFSVKSTGKWFTGNFENITATFLDPDSVTEFKKFKSENQVLLALSGKLRVGGKSVKCLVYTRIAHSGVSTSGNVIGKNMILDLNELADFDTNTKESSAELAERLNRYFINHPFEGGSVSPR